MLGRAASTNRHSKNAAMSKKIKIGDTVNISLTGLLSKAAGPADGIYKGYGVVLTNDGVALGCFTPEELPSIRAAIKVDPFREH